MFLALFQVSSTKLLEGAAFDSTIEHEMKVQKYSGMAITLWTSSDLIQVKLLCSLWKGWMWRWTPSGCWVLLYSKTFKFRAFCRDYCTV